MQSDSDSGQIAIQPLAELLFTPGTFRPRLRGLFRLARGSHQRSQKPEPLAPTPVVLCLPPLVLTTRRAT